MPTPNQSYALVFPDGTEYVGESRPQDLQSLCEMAVTKKGFSTPRKTPLKVTVEVFRLVVGDGKLNRVKERTVLVRPPMERMTEKEFDAEMAEVLSGLPVEFHSFVSGYAWDQGHSCGYEEVILYASDLAEGLAAAVKAFEGRVDAQK